ncbi:MAG TPA: bifunctional diaminohydroxyphosphoribosylaminopyrimidine deaminase/5-amino-6-(5-phosphoribosylamino)uracil reductase RibD [Pirellulales bacterium]|jgi:diaminohydroxyphosphoribosylaminopyrimidine deaminase/5-amino-6-(5-phosphoribosylamino)uracil reductase|nr:bifunctional diaminohydroxyphosphoribosylaminopyrimidine deaminase/5-amino-6-(5-phosphoribosylamino)uracil reductase RibD [Pirellulales bacterium]
MDPHELDRWHMRRALELAAGGRGRVEPNPLVGCVIARGAEIIAEGWHRQYGGPHAEVDALAMAGNRAAGATVYVTLEPCCHFGKTPPCTRALIAAGVSRVVAAMHDPFPVVAGQGEHELRAAGIEVETGVLEEEARALNAPYLKLTESGLPWVIAKWAMTLDGKIATRTGESRWISSEASRRVVHELRGRVDAVIVGSRTAQQDDPLLTARPPGVRQAVRIVIDSQAALSPDSQLARTARQVPLIVAAAASAPAENRQRLTSLDCEVLSLTGTTHAGRLRELLAELGRRRMTNALVEGGGMLLGTLADLGQIDELHVFVAPRVMGGTEAPSPIGGQGVARVCESLSIDAPQWCDSGGDLYLSGRVIR